MPLTRLTLHFLALAFVLLLAAERVKAHDIYTGLKGADGTHCCSGGPSGDCYPTKAEFRNGSWYALRREDQKWVRIPEEKFAAPVASDGRAHLCSFGPSSWAPDPVPRCFIPPEGGV